MKINKSNNITILFESLNVGDIFKFKDNIYIKIPKFSSIKSLTENTYNSYNIINNAYAYFFDDSQVIPYPNATLNLN